MGYDLMSHRKQLNAVLKLHRTGPLVGAFSVEHLAESAHFNRFTAPWVSQSRKQSQLESFYLFNTCQKLRSSARCDPKHLTSEPLL